MRSQLAAWHGDSAGCTKDNPETRKLAGGRKYNVWFGECVHASSFICACGVQYLHTELSELTHDACLGLSIAWACLPNAVADLTNMKGNIVDVRDYGRVQCRLSDSRYVITDAYSAVSRIHVDYFRYYCGGY